MTKCNLEHELLDDTVERAALVVEGFASAAHALLAGAEAAEVLTGLGELFSIELHGDASCRSTTDGDIEEDTGAGHFSGRIQGVEKKKVGTFVRFKNSNIRDVSVFGGLSGVPIMEIRACVSETIPYFVF